MKYLFLLLIVCLTACDNESKKMPSGLLSSDVVKNPRNANGDDQAALANMGRLVFKDSLHNFGDLKEGDIVIHEFEYQNVGKEPIIINEVKVSCGCTMPEYSTEPIKPGESGFLKISFNSEGKAGYQAKKVSVYTNGNPREYILEILAAVQPK